MGRLNVTEAENGEVMKITDTPVVVFLTAVLSAFVMGGGGLIWLDSHIDDQVADEVAKVKSTIMPVQFTVSQEFNAVAVRGKEDLTPMGGGHKACFLTGSQDENDEQNAVAICKVNYEGGEWRLRARGARCNAVCID